MVLGKLQESCNMDNAKKMTVVLVILCIVFHAYLHSTLPAKEESCSWMFEEGKFVRDNFMWQPKGCNIYTYSRYDANACFKSRGVPTTIVFSGGPSIRDQYLSLLGTITGQQQNADGSQKVLKFTVKALDLQLEYHDVSPAPTAKYTVYESWIPPTVDQSEPQYVINVTMDTTLSKKGYTWNSLTRILDHFQESDSSSVNEIGTQMLLNKLCNDELDIGGNLCCKSPQRPSITFAQATIIGLAFLSVLAWLFMKLNKRNSESPKEHTESSTNNNTQSGKQTDIEAGVALLPKQNESETKETPVAEVVVKPAAKKEKKPEGLPELAMYCRRFLFILVYFILCDRNNFFQKANKHFTLLHFFVPLTTVLILGIVFNKKSSSTVVLHRDQTDEWKGWMQLVILIYHVTGASQNLLIYMQIRVLVSAYLFMSGFGHFYFYFSKGDYSFHRFCVVMYRCNWLVVLLCFTMERPYQFYYFVPLVSFWFVVCYAIMAVWPRVTLTSAEERNLNYLFMVLKIAALVAIITVFYLSQTLFTLVFDNPVMRPFFALSDGSVREWFFRWKIDRYSTIYGMVFALYMIAAKKRKIIDDGKEENLYSLTNTAVLLSFAAAGVMGYFTFTTTCESKEGCNSIHAYISCIPILSFVVLRNVVGFVRIRFSYFYAWFGKISLELFIAQYHIWLASDTHKILVLVPGLPLVNICVTSFIFVCVAHEISFLTAKLTHFIVPNDNKILLRNMVIFLSLCGFIMLKQKTFHDM